MFLLADQLAIETYHSTADFPIAERFGLQRQIRRAAVSAVTNIVEGSARRSTNEYLSFLNVASASAAEARYLIDLSHRLGFVPMKDQAQLAAGYTELIAGLQAVIRALATSRRLEP